MCKIDDEKFDQKSVSGVQLTRCPATPKTNKSQSANLSSFHFFRAPKH
jgi:hypothetical protein